MQTNWNQSLFHTTYFYDLSDKSINLSDVNPGSIDYINRLGKILERFALPFQRQGVSKSNHAAILLAQTWTSHQRYN